MDLKPEERATRRDPYDVLGVSRTASLAEIREAYWRQVRFHSMGSEGGLRLQELREAYETLTDPARRASLDPAGDGEPAYVPPVAPQPDPHAAEVARRRQSRNPLDRLTAGLPRPWRIAIDWIVTIAGAIAIVLAIKAWVVNPYRIPSSSME